MQLVASRRGVAALPNWGIRSYVDHDYVMAKSIGKQGLWSNLYLIASQETITKQYVIDLNEIIRNTCLTQLDAIQLI
jgi:LysR family transcriptional regulator for metE and metH